MLTISLTHHPHARKELLLGKTLRVVSRSGLNPTERALIEQLPALKSEDGAFRSPLFLGGRTGALALALWLTRGREVQGALTLHTLDAHVQGTLERNLAENHAPLAAPGASFGFACSTAPDLAGVPPGNIAFWQMTKGDGTAEQHLALLERLASDAFLPGLRLLIAADESFNETFLKRFRKACGNAITLRREGAVYILSGRVLHPAPVADLPDHRAAFTVSLRGHAPLELVTLPGCFCHRRADMGGLALAETVADQVAFDRNDRVMDMGCGCGMVGLLLAAAFPEKDLRIDYQDSNAAARESTQLNLHRYPHNARFFFSAEGMGERAAYDLFLANPPYFGDWRIAQAFIESAARLLKPGGILAFVSKREAKPLELITAAGFEPLGAFSRRGYTILLAARR